MVRLTVTDDDGATGTVSRSIAVTAPPPPSTVLARDEFTRTVANGFGTAAVGGAAWTASSTAANYRVDGTTGRITLPSAGVTPARRSSYRLRHGTSTPPST